MATSPLNGGYTPFGVPNLTGQFDLGSMGFGDASSGVAGVADLGAQDGGLFSMSSLLGGRGANGAYQQGWAMPAIAAGGGVLQGLLGMKQYGLAQDQFKESKRQYNQNYEAQKTTTNAALEDRQRARVASNPGAYQSVADYLDKNKVV